MELRVSRRANARRAPRGHREQAPLRYEFDIRDQVHEKLLRAPWRRQLWPASLHSNITMNVHKYMDFLSERKSEGKCAGTKRKEMQQSGLGSIRASILPLKANHSVSLH